MKRIALPSPITKAAAPKRPCIRPSTTSPALGPSADSPPAAFRQRQRHCRRSPEAIQEVAMVSRHLAEMIIQSLQKEQHESV